MLIFCVIIFRFLYLPQITILTEYKSHEPLQLEHCARVRFNAVLAISNFQPLFQNVRNICQLLFLETEEQV